MIRNNLPFAFLAENELHISLIPSVLLLVIFVIGKSQVYIYLL